MNSFERYASLCLALLFSLRMLGLFMILPVIALYQDILPGANLSTIGLIVGIYGGIQACFQLPFGLLSDRFGRKPLLLLGLGLFALGSLIGSCAQTAQGILWARALQGAGAIGAVILATLADLTREHVRSKAMAIVGISIALSFALAFMLGPYINSQFGLNGIFALCAGLAVLGIGVLLRFVPEPQKKGTSRKVSWNTLKDVFGHQALMVFNLGILILHAVLTAFFLFLPHTISQTFHIDTAMHWQVYLPIIALSFMLVFPCFRKIDLSLNSKAFFTAAILILMFSECLLGGLRHTTSSILVSLLFFFVAFNFLETTLPAWVSKLAPSHLRGTAMGVFSSCQFLGMGLGGMVGGYLNQRHGVKGILIWCLLLSGIWFILTLRLSLSMENKTLPRVKNSKIV